VDDLTRGSKNNNKRKPRKSIEQLEDSVNKSQ
jgi:hypothetical protein